MSKQIYYAMYCDEWKSHDSERLMFIGTSPQKLKMVISKAIENDEAYYHCDGFDEMTTQKKQAKEFRKDFAVLTRRELNDRLEYIYFDYTYNNEEM